MLYRVYELYYVETIPYNFILAKAKPPYFSNVVFVYSFSCFRPKKSRSLMKSYYIISDIYIEWHYIRTYVRDWAIGRRMRLFQMHFVHRPYFHDFGATPVYLGLSDFYILYKYIFLYYVIL